MQKLLVLAVMSFLFVACNGQKKTAKSFEAALEVETGQAHSIAKLQTEKGNFTVFRNDVTGEYVAYNMDGWNRETMTSFSQYTGGAPVKNLAKDREWVVSGYWEPIYDYYTDYYDVYDSFCDCYVSESRTVEVYVGDRYVDTSYWYTFYVGGGFRFENTAGVSKDLETIAALKDEAAESLMKFKFKSEFALSDNRAGELAKLASKYTKLENARELTTSEKDKFALSALGVSMNQVEAALKAKAQGQDAQYAELLKKAAQVNSTSPESIGKFFDEMADAI